MQEGQQERDPLSSLPLLQRWRGHESSEGLPSAPLASKGGGDPEGPGLPRDSTRARRAHEKAGAHL